MYVRKEKHFIHFFKKNREVYASEFLENPEEMFSYYWQ